MSRGFRKPPPPPDMGQWQVVETVRGDGRVVYTVEQEHGLVVGYDMGGKWETRWLWRAKRVRDRMRAQDQARKTVQRKVIR